MTSNQQHNAPLSSDAQTPSLCIAFVHSRSQAEGGYHIIIILNRESTANDDIASLNRQPITRTRMGLESERAEKKV